MDITAQQNHELERERPLRTLGSQSGFIIIRHEVIRLTQADPAHRYCRIYVLSSQLAVQHIGNEHVTRFVCNRQRKLRLNQRDLRGYAAGPKYWDLGIRNLRAAAARERIKAYLTMLQDDRITKVGFVQVQDTNRRWISNMDRATHITLKCVRPQVVSRVVPSMNSRKT